MNLSQPGDSVGTHYGAIFGPIPLNMAAQHWNDLAPDIRQYLATAQAPFRTQWHISHVPKSDSHPATINIRHEHTADALAFTPQQAEQLFTTNQWNSIPGYRECPNQRDQRHLRRCVRTWLTAVVAPE